MSSTIRDPWNGLRGNLLLRSLAPRHALMLAPLLRRETFGPGALLAVGEDGLSGKVYFPETLVACLVDLDHPSGIGMIGREGVIGWDGMCGLVGRDHRAFVHLAGGSALVIGSRKLHSAAELSSSLAIALTRFLLALSTQMSRTIRSNLHDPIDARVSGWLLMLHDRTNGDELRITHQALAALLNLRRASVTDAMHILEGEHAVRCTRGCIVIRDRGKLEDLAGSAYGASERSYRDAIGPFGKSASTRTAPGIATQAAQAGTVANLACHGQAAGA